MASIQVLDFFGSTKGKCPLHIFWAEMGMASIAGVTYKSTSCEVL